MFGNMYKSVSTPRARPGLKLVLDIYFMSNRLVLKNRTDDIPIPALIVQHCSYVGSFTKYIENLKMHLDHIRAPHL